jgi:hypothetical protein
VLRTFRQQRCVAGNGVPHGTPFKVDQANALIPSRFRLIDPLADNGPETIRVTVATNPILEVLRSGRPAAEKFARGGPVSLKLNPIALQPDHDYAILTAVDGAPVAAEGSTLANEHWDDRFRCALTGATASVLSGLNSTTTIPIRQTNWPR